MPKRETEKTHRELSEELERVKRDYEQFAYIVSHDLAAPFRQIQGFANIIKKNLPTTLDPDAERHFKFILDGAEQGQKVLGALLEYSRLNNTEINFELCNCNDIVSFALQQNQTLIEATSAHVNVQTLPSVNADVNMLSQVFSHIIQNSLVYKCDELSPLIEIKAEERTEEWVISVCDNGQGIASNIREKVFQPLRRGVTDKHESSGMGMGLTICKNIIEQLGGVIWLEPNQVEGTTISFSIKK